MSLDFRFTKIENYKELCYTPDGDVSPRTKYLIFATIPIGIGTFTPKNIEEVVRRVLVWQEITGPALVDGNGNDVRITAEEIRKHVGLSTNASPRTEAQFAKVCYRTLCDRVWPRR